MGCIRPVNNTQYLLQMEVAVLVPLKDCLKKFLSHFYMLARRGVQHDQVPSIEVWLGFWMVVVAGAAELYRAGVLAAIIVEVVTVHCVGIKMSTWGGPYAQWIIVYYSVQKIHFWIKVQTNSNGLIDKVFDCNIFLKAKRSRKCVHFLSKLSLTFER